MNEKKKMLIGVNTFDSDVLGNKPAFALVSDYGKNLDYALCHFDPNRTSVDEACIQAEEAGKIFADRGMDYIANFEFQNFGVDSRGKDGYNWAGDDKNAHCFTPPEKYKEAHAKNSNCIGFMYDEFEHCISNVNLSLTLATKLKLKIPVFPLEKSGDFHAQSELLSSQLREYVRGIKESGIKEMYGEHVFPILFHKFAQNGINPNFKSQKESYSDIQYAVASGAALEYGTELSNCVDLWYRLTNPGHSPEEMYSNLEFAYFAGVDRVYVESSHAMVTSNDENGVLNEYGKKFIEFSRKYKGKERNYSATDLRPEIGIIRCDDTFWGQCDPVMWRRMLFGNKKIKPDYRSREYIRVFHILTHGESCRNGLSWGRISPWSLRKHRSFASLNSTCVFDEKVRYDTLKSLKLCFLCGREISSETISDVEKLVKENGLTVVTTSRFAPDRIKSEIKGSYSEIKDGKGRWIVVKSFENSKLKNTLAPYIGNKGEMRITFENDEIKMKISENGETFTVI